MQIHMGTKYLPEREAAVQLNPDYFAVKGFLDAYDERKYQPTNLNLRHYWQADAQAFQDTSCFWLSSAICGSRLQEMIFEAGSNWSYGLGIFMSRNGYRRGESICSNYIRSLIYALTSRAVIILGPDGSRITMSQRGLARFEDAAGKRRGKEPLPFPTPAARLYKGYCWSASSTSSTAHAYST